MTTLWPSLLLTALAVLLTVATSASAECAWVMWIMLDGKVDYRGSAYTSGKDCTSKLDRKEKMLRPDSTVFLPHAPHPLAPDSQTTCGKTQ